MNKRLVFLVVYMCLFFITSISVGQATQKIYLSGTGTDNTVDWEFYCTEGSNSGKWTSLPVPSNWELHGFGKYNYGHAKDSVRGKESGLYKYRFEALKQWKGQQVEIVFDGSMTDTEVKINGRLAGPIHQGSFYRFKYNISSLLDYGKTNVLEVKVDKHSANQSVNKAERYSDFWIFGGIFRPVWLEVKPDENIDRVAIDAKADGTFASKVFLNELKSADQLKAQIFSLDGTPVGESFSVDLEKGMPAVELVAKIKGVNPWNPEYPNLYKACFYLMKKGEPVHEYTERFGFRTIEVRKRDGIYVNGVKIKIKGVNRHTFWPTTGRASSKKRSIEDVQTIKSMNMNGVRMAHYPPDSHFLDVCDSLGLFVLNELTGWHDAYDTEVGSILVKEMIERDVNHPSIILWDNGNEGGHNYELLPLYSKYDIQQRTVLHPWQTFNGVSTEHYRGYDYGMGTFWHGREITLPTEFLHGMHDGGQGSALYDYWELIWKTPIAAGGFIWDFADQGVLRVDKNDELDTYNSKGADGILGPYHEKEGSYFAIKEIWSPVQLEPRNLTAEFDGKLYLENRYLYTNLNECKFTWELVKLSDPFSSSKKESLNGKCVAPDLAPRQKGYIELKLPQNWQFFDVLYVTVTNRYGMELYTWSYPISLPADVLAGLLKEKADTPAVTFTENDSLFHVNAGGIKYILGKNDGLLKKVQNEKGEIPFNNGPVICAGKTVFQALRSEMKEDTLLVTCSYAKESRMKELVWKFYPSGWAELAIAYLPEVYDVPFDYMGVNFSYPEKLVEGVKWMGHGPYRVWKNRMQGVELAVHQKDYNSTMTGIYPVVYPEFKGYHSNLYWAKIQSKEQSFLLATTTEDVFLRLFTPDQPEDYDKRLAPPFPSGDISFMQGISAMGSKTNDSWNMGPSGQKNVFFDFGPYDDWRIRCKRMTLFFNFSTEN
ncbi:glycoside hydrolase family 2 TIM barrel-domain containing protein [uncultured Draconibacterium sp.]|uniref:glycoside hydrolase family 2 protein n=1 Tax=uncultured Draconibacterium sp. TaxID=1573823 RepID=UPI0025F3ADD0|nr:glycoside hydrolase family 2 TIM barrel-domain containing protein [uncultured Draconibacterium sp.]